MPNVDDRIVSVSFENTKFEANVTTTLGTLTKLDGALKNVGGNAGGLSKIETESSKVTLSGPMSALDKLKAKLGSSGQGAAVGMSQIESAGSKVTLAGPNNAVDKLQGKMGQLSAGSTFSDIENAANNTTLSGLSNAIDNVSNKFSVLKGSAAVALGNIASQAASKGASFAKSFAIGPIQQGLGEYQTNLGSIQTILANTQDSGGNLKSVNGALDELNTYSDKTIYNFSEMAKNIGTFTAAGVQLKPATSAIKGIANLAALSGSNSGQASTAMYQLSQAIASGKVGLQDWNSVVNAGMGGAVFQKSLMRTAENMGAIKKGAVNIDKATGKATVNGETFRDSIMAKPGQKSWLTSDVLTQTLSQMTGDMTDAQLAAKGFDKEQIKSIQRQAKSAQDAATQVKTLPQVFDVARETIGSGWSQTFKNLFGDFGESKKTFTELSNTINGFINTNSKARNKVLKVWHDLGGRTILINGIKIAFKDLIAVIKPIHDAFREIFPPKTGQDLVQITRGFTGLMERLKPGPETVANLKRTFAGIFAVFHIAEGIIGGLIKVFFRLFGIVGGEGGGTFLNFTAGVGDFLVSIDKAITKGGLLTSFFNGLSTVLRAPLTLIGKLTTAIGGLFQPSGKGQTFSDHIDELNEFGRTLTPLERIVNRIKDAWAKLLDKFSGVKTALEPFFSSFVDKLKGLGDIIKQAFDGLNYDDVVSGLQTGLLAGILVALKKALGIDVAKKLGNPFEGINKVLGGFTGQMEAMQSKLHAEALLAIAGAVAVLAAGLFVLSKIPADQLTKALTATAIGLGELMGAMKLMTGGMGKLGALQLPIIAAGIIGLAFAVVILAGAMKIFATMSWEDIAKGMSGIAGSLGSIGLAMKLMGGGPSLALQAAGLILIGVALNLIAAAVKVFATMKWEDLSKGLFAIVESLGLIAIGVSLMPPTLPLTAAGLILIGVALNEMAVAVAAFGAIDLVKMLTGLGGMAATLVILGATITAFPPTLALQAAGLILLSQALIIMAGAIAAMGAMKPEVMAKGLLGLGAALITLAGGLSLMEASVPGAVALLAASAALAVLVPTIALMGSLSWGTIFKGLAGVAATIIVVGLASTIAAPGLIELGIALIPLGIGMAAVAGAVYLFSKGLSLLGDVGPKAITVMIAAITAFVAALPSIVISFVKGLLDIIGQITVLLPKVIAALAVVLQAIIAFVIAQAPNLAIAIGVLVDSFLKVLVENTPKIIAAGAKLILDFLTGLGQNIGQITTKAVTVIVNFLNALTANAPRLVSAGATTILAFLQGIQNHIPDIVAKVGSLIGTFLVAVGQQSYKLVNTAGTLMVGFIAGIGRYLDRLITAGTNLVVNFITGVGKAAPRIITAGVNLAGKLLHGIASGLVKLANVGFRAVIDFLNGIADAIRNNDDDLIDAGANIMDALIDGVVKAAGRLAGPLKSAIEKLFGLLPHWARKILHITSPSKVFVKIGQQTMAGMAVGINRSGSHVNAVMEATTGNIVKTAQTTLGKVPNALDGIIDAQPVITPVLDLTNVHKEAQNMPDPRLMIPVKAAASLDHATSISQAQQAVADAKAAADVQRITQPPTVHFEQNNYSPEALSDIDIYRQTHNQLSLAKDALGLRKR